MKRAFVDLQVNGYMGVDFSSPTLTRAGIEEVCRRLLEKGTGAFLPTVVTAAPETYEQVLPLLSDAAKKPPEGARILGIHLEGPFISPVDGARGAHPLNNIREPDGPYFKQLIKLCGGTLKLVTLAPELDKADEIIETAVGQGIAVSSGHTITGYQAMDAAVGKGLSMITHIGNGCPREINRHHNPLFAQLSSGAVPMIIPDGHHLPKELIKLVARVAGREKLIAVSDVSPVGGLPPGDYESFGTPVTLRPDGKLICRGSDYLAGSASTLMECLNWLASEGWQPEDLWRLGRENPLKALGFDPERIVDAGVVWRNGRFETS